MKNNIYIQPALPYHVTHPIYVSSSLVPAVPRLSVCIAVSTVEIRYLYFPDGSTVYTAHTEGLQLCSVYTCLPVFQPYSISLSLSVNGDHIVYMCGVVVFGRCV